MSQRMKLTVQAFNDVVLQYTDVDGTRIERRFFTCHHADGRDGYVQEIMDDGRYRQVGEALGRTGNMVSSTVADLPATIRREYRAMRRAQAKFL